MLAHEGGRQVAGADRERIMASNSLDRFFGGPPARTLIWLIALSVVIGFLLATVGLDPVSLVNRVIYEARHFIDYILNFGTDALASLIRYFIYGAVVVVPLWLLSRLLSMGRRG